MNKLSRKRKQLALSTTVCQRKNRISPTEKPEQKKRRSKRRSNGRPETEKTDSIQTTEEDRGNTDEAQKKTRTKHGQKYRGNKRQAKESTTEPESPETKTEPNENQTKPDPERKIDINSSPTLRRRHKIKEPYPKEREADPHEMPEM